MGSDEGHCPWDVFGVIGPRARHTLLLAINPITGYLWVTKMRVSAHIFAKRSLNMGDFFS